MVQNLEKIRRSSFYDLVSQDANYDSECADRRAFKYLST